MGTCHSAYRVALCGLVLLSSGAAAGLPLFTEDFSSATGTFEVTTLSELSASTDYYSNPTVPGWSLSAEGVFLADVGGDVAMALNEFPSHGSATTPTITGFTPGEQYELSFFHFGDTEPNTTSYELDVLLDASVIGHLSRVYTSPGPGATANFVFTATAASHTLSFVDVTVVGQASAMIDNIDVSAVPEPRILALLLAALGWLGHRIGRRRESASV